MKDDKKPTDEDRRTADAAAKEVRGNDAAARPSANIGDDGSNDLSPTLEEPPIEQSQEEGSPKPHARTADHPSSEEPAQPSSVTPAQVDEAVHPSKGIEFEPSNARVWTGSSVSHPPVVSPPAPPQTDLSEIVADQPQESGQPKEATKANVPPSTPAPSIASDQVVEPEFNFTEQELAEVGTDESDASVPHAADLASESGPEPDNAVMLEDEVRPQQDETVQSDDAVMLEDESKVELDDLEKKRADQADLDQQLSPPKMETVHRGSESVLEAQDETGAIIPDEHDQSNRPSIGLPTAKDRTDWSAFERKDAPPRQPSDIDENIELERIGDEIGRGKPGPDVEPAHRDMESSELDMLGDVDESIGEIRPRRKGEKRKKKPTWGRFLGGAGSGIGRIGGAIGSKPLQTLGGVLQGAGQVYGAFEGLFGDEGSDGGLGGIGLPGMGSQDEGSPIEEMVSQAGSEAASLPEQPKQESTKSDTGELAREIVRLRESMDRLAERIGGGKAGFDEEGKFTPSGDSTDLTGKLEELMNVLRLMATLARIAGMFA